MKSLMILCAFFLVVSVCDCNFTVTRSVSGAVYPVDSSGSECTSAMYNKTPCECYGGGARQAAFAGTNSVLLDFGGFFYGSGLFYDEHNVLVSIDIFNEMNPTMHALHWRDFLPALRPDVEVTGGQALARILSDTAAPAVASNFDVVRDQYLGVDSLVHTHTLIQDDSGNKIAVLALLDKGPLERISPHYAARCLLYEKSLIKTLAEVRPSTPDHVVLLVSGFSIEDIEDILPQSAVNITEAEALRTLMSKFSEIDLVIVDGSESLGVALGGPGTVQTVNNVNDKPDVTIVVTENAKRGSAVTVIESVLPKSNNWMASISKLDCTYPQNDTIRHELDNYKIAIEKKMSDVNESVIGFIRGSLGQCDAQSCFASDFAADAIQWWAAADVAFQLSSFKSVDWTENVLKANELLLAYPDLGSDIVRVHVSGKRIRRFLSEIISEGKQGALHTAASLKVEWNKVDTMGIELVSIRINGLDVQDDSIYSIAGTEQMIETFFLTSDEIVTRTPLGTQTYGAVTAYISTFYGSKGSNLEPEREFSIERIERLSDVRVINIALLCGDTPERMQQCDHGLHAIELLNAQAAIFEDFLIPGFKLVPYTTNVGCAENRAQEALTSLFLTENRSFDTVIVACSDDVIDVSSVATRAAISLQTKSVQPDYLVISPSSTAPSLSDAAKYPYLLRLATPDNFNGHAASSLTREYEWSRILVIHDDSSFSTEAAQAFVDEFLSVSSNNEVLGAGKCIKCSRNVHDGATVAVGISFSQSAFENGTINARDLLDAANELCPKIIYLATYQKNQRLIFGEVYRGRILYSEGFAWIANPPSNSASRNEETGDVDTDAVEGLIGALGFIERIPAYADGGIISQYLNEHWNRSIDSSDCVLSTGMATKITYCDVDGDHRTTQDYALFWIDAILVYAKGLREIVSGSSDMVHGANTTSLVYSTILHLGTVNGMTGPIFFDPISGDRLGSFVGVNFRPVSDQSPLVPGSYVEFADYDVRTGALDLLNEALFPGEVTTIPEDVFECSASRKKNNDLKKIRVLLLGVLIPIGGLFICLALGIFLVYQKYIRSQAELKMYDFAYEATKNFAKEDCIFEHGGNGNRGWIVKQYRCTWQSRLEETISGHVNNQSLWIEYDDNVQDVLIREYLKIQYRSNMNVQPIPITLEKHSAETALESYSLLRPKVAHCCFALQRSDVRKSSDHNSIMVKVDVCNEEQISGDSRRCIQFEPKSRELWGSFLWYEELRRRENHDKVEFIDGDLWVYYKDSVQDLLCQAYQKYIDCPSESNEEVYFSDEWITIQNSNDPNCIYEINFAFFEQRNMKSNYTRRIRFEYSRTCNKWHIKQTHNDLLEVKKGDPLRICDRDGDMLLAEVENDSSSGVQCCFGSLAADCMRKGWIPNDCVNLREDIQRQPSNGKNLGYMSFLRGGIGSTHSTLSLSKPSHWTRTDEYIEVENTDERMRVCCLFTEIPNWHVESVARIQNLQNWQHYMVALHRGQSIPHHDVTEYRNLFHGTSFEAAQSIVRHGFDKSMAAEGSKFGRAIYLSERVLIAFYHAEQYEVNQQQRKCVIVVRILETLDDRALGCYDEARRDHTHLVHHNNQAYPEYLVTLCRETLH